jgi:hypothetical protein
VAEQFLAAHTTPAGGNDAAPHGSGIDTIGRNESGPCEWYGDSAYGTGDLRYALGQAGHAAVLKPKPLQAGHPGTAGRAVNAQELSWSIRWRAEPWFSAGTVEQDHLQPPLPTSLARHPRAFGSLTSAQCR